LAVGGERHEDGCVGLAGCGCFAVEGGEGVGVGGGEVGCCAVEATGGVDGFGPVEGQRWGELQQGLAVGYCGCGFGCF